MSISDKRSVRAFTGGLAFLTLAGTIAAAPPSMASKPGDAARFDTWVGYDVGRAPTGVVSADLNGDALPDAVWTREDFFNNSITVTMNLGDGTLGASRSYPTGSQSTGVVDADLDGDGDVDLAVASRGDGYDNDSVDLYMNDGNGSFTRSSVSGGDGPEAITEGDVDNDGDLDLVLANQPMSLSILRNDGTGEFAAEELVELPAQVSDVAIGDMTGDGATDLTVVLPSEEASSYALHILERGPDREFMPDATPQVVAMSVNGGTGGGGASLAAADLDGDGDSDLALSAAAAFEHIVLLNRGTGSFAVESYESRVARMIVSDVDRDDDVDLLGVGGGGGTGGTATIQRNTGDGSFTSLETFVTGSNAVDAAAADVDADGRLDLLVAARDVGAGVVHQQREDGTFSSPAGGALFAPSVDVATGDVDGDGDVDVAAAMGGPFGNGETIEVRLNNGGGTLVDGPTVAAGGTDPRSLVAGDLDSDGDADLSWLIGHGTAQRVGSASSNGNGTFEPAVLHTMPTCSDHLSLGDVDGDGDLDHIVGNEDFGCEADSNAVSIRRNNGDGGFAGPAQLVTMSFFPTDTEVADMNNDEIPDLVGGGSGQGGQDDMAVALGNGDGDFADPILSDTGLAHRELVVRDLDADGAPDVASLASDRGVVVMHGDGAGGFSSWDLLEGERISGYRNAVGLAVGDIDGDRILDIAVANETGSDVGIHAGLGDGSFEPRQVRYGMRPRVTDVELADLDNDGILDVVSPAQLPGPTFAGGARARGVVRAAEDAPGLTLLLGRRPKCTIVGTPAADTLRGSRGADVICGLGGNDVLVGRGASDVLRGGAGKDRLRGDAGVDVLTGDAGRDALRGGTNGDFLRGGRSGDVLLGQSGRDVIDLLDKTRGNDRGSGGSGNDHCRRDRRDQLSGC